MSLEKSYQHMQRVMSHKIAPTIFDACYSLTINDLGVTLMAKFTAELNLLCSQWHADAEQLSKLSAVATADAGPQLTGYVYYVVMVQQTTEVRIVLT